MSKYILSNKKTQVEVQLVFSAYVSPHTTSLCSHIFLVVRDHGVYMYVFTFENGVLLMR